MLNVLRIWHIRDKVTNAEARFNKIHIRKVYACLAVTCHCTRMTGIFLRATAVTRGWNGYRNKSQHRKSTLEKKILPPFQQGFEPATFQSRVRCSNHWAIPAPLPNVWTTLPLYTPLLPIAFVNTSAFTPPSLPPVMTSAPSDPAYLRCHLVLLMMMWGLMSSDYSGWHIRDKWSFCRWFDIYIGRFSEAGLLEWMRFVIFRARSRERSQRTSGPISE